jgi:ABC-type multidrug transport system permease subunit
MGSAIAHGQVPYRDVMQGQPPVGFYLDALAIFLFGQTPWAIWWINVIWIILSTALFFIILKRMFSLAASMLASLIFTVAVMLPSLFMGGNLMEVFGLLPQVLIIGATFSFFSTKQNRWIAIIEANYYRSGYRVVYLHSSLYFFMARVEFPLEENGILWRGSSYPDRSYHIIFFPGWRI